MLRVSAAVVLLFVTNWAAFVMLMTTGRAIRGEPVFAVPAVLLLGICVALTWTASKLWSNWRAGLAVCLGLGALMSFQLASGVPPGDGAAAVSRDYFIIAAALLLSAGAAVASHLRTRRLPA